MVLSRKKKKGTQGRPSLKDLRSSYFTRLNSLGNDRDTLLKLIKSFFVDYLDQKAQLSFDDLPPLLAKRRIDQDTKDQVIAFADDLVEAEYSPVTQHLAYALVEEQFRKIVFLLTMKKEEDDEKSIITPVKKITKRYISPFMRLYRHFVLAPEINEELKHFHALHKKCLRAAEDKNHALAKREYKAALRHYEKLAPIAQEKAYPALQKAHHCVIRSIPHEAHLQKILNTLPKKITKGNLKKWTASYAQMVRHYRQLDDVVKEHYYPKLREFRMMLTQQNT